MAWRQLDAQGQLVTDCKETGATRCPGALGIPFAFHSAFSSAGTGLVYFRNRWYSATANQWLSQDPLGAVDSANLYAFDGFDPVNFVDPWGLQTKNHAEPGREWNFDDFEVEGKAPKKKPDECDEECQRILRWEQFHPTGAEGIAPVSVCTEFNDYCTRTPPAAPQRPTPPPRNPLDPDDPRPDLCRSPACKINALRLLARRHDPNADLRIPTPKGQAFLARNERFIGRSYFLGNYDNLFGPPRDFIDWIQSYGGFDIGVGLTKEDEDLQPVSDEVADERTRRGATTLVNTGVEYGGYATMGLGIVRAPAGLVDFGEQRLYRQGGSNPGNLKVRPGDATGVSFRDSLSNPLNTGEPPVFNAGRDYIVVDPGRLPPGSVVPDNVPPGHVGVRASPEEIKKAIVGKGTLPK